MINNQLRQEIAEINPDILLFDNPSFDNSIIGFDTNDNIVYDLDLMIEELMHDDEISYTDALDFIEYNTIRTIPYMSVKPVIVRRLIE